MKIVSLFRTDDGKTFENKNDARRHEIELEALKKLGELLKTSLQTMRPDSVLKQILMESNEITAILSTYRKKQPIEKKEAA